MNRKDVINVLKMENDLITFDPHTGEEIDVRCLNDLNKKCYIAHEEAIDFLRQSIPIDWILKWACEFIDPNSEGYKMAMELVHDWRKENEEGN